MSGFILLALMIVAYMVPSIVCFYRNTGNKVAISALNLVSGWTLVGWIACFIWAFVDKKGA